MKCAKCEELQRENQQLIKLIKQMAESSGYIKYLADTGLKEIMK